MNVPRLVSSLMSVIVVVAIGGCGQPGGEASTAAPTPPSAELVDLPPLSNVEVPVVEPSESNTVTWGLAIDPGSISTGKALTVAVKARVASGWHIYAVDQPTGVNTATKLEMVLPKGISAVGDWEFPPAHELDSDTFAYEDQVTFRRHLMVSPDCAAGIANIECKVAFQSCNDAMCTPPTSTTVSAVLEIVH